MRHAFFAVVVMLAIFASADVLAQSGPPVENIDPGEGGGDGVLGCSECTREADGSGQCYFDADGGHWRNCDGGTICWRTADGGEYCQPYCGESRCYLA